MVKRKADELIRNFILNDRRSLLVTGARQVGKTFSIRKVGKECFDNVVEKQSSSLWTRAVTSM